MKNINLEQKIANLGPARRAEGRMNAQRAQKSQLGPLSIFMAATLFLRTVKLLSNGYFQIYQQALTASPYLFPQKREPLRKADWIDNPPYLEMISLNQKK